MQISYTQVNEWFDVFNSNLKYGHHSDLHAYDINLEEQNKIINNMSEFNEEMREVNFIAIPKGIFNM